EHRAGVDLERQVELERSTARLLGVQVDLPCLAHRVGLDEVALVVDVEAVIRGVVLEVGDEAGDIEQGHPQQSARPGQGRGTGGAGGAGTLAGVHVDRILRLLDDTAAAVIGALDAHAVGRPDLWRLGGERPGQYRLDLVADDAAVPVLRKAGVGILSEESGLHDPGCGITVVIDPVDGSTNASRGIPWYATSLCAVDDSGPLAALVVNLATGARYQAVRGGGATLDGRPVKPSGVTRAEDSLL